MPIKNAAIVSFMEAIADNMLTMRAFNIMFAIVIVYNSATYRLPNKAVIWPRCV